MPTRYKGTPRETRALNAYITLMRAAQSVTSRLQLEIAERGLTPGQFSVLEAILHCGPLRLSDLAHKVLTSCGNITVIINNLERDGLVRRVRDSEDRRSFLVELTRDGERKISELFPCHVERLVREFKILQPDEQERLAEMCRALGLQTRETT